MADSMFPPIGSERDDANAVYALGSSPGESARLRRQADELAVDSAAVLDRVGLRPGQAAIDLGCGPQGILDLLAERVAPAGRVVGLDADPAHAAMASEFAAARRLSGVQIVTADARYSGPLMTGSGGRGTASSGQEPDDLAGLRCRRTYPRSARYATGTRPGRARPT